MITKWGLSNFKSIKNAEIKLAPLTVFTGTNSSGKSSFLQSILLIAQTLRNPIHSRELVLNGPLLNTGFFKDIQSDLNKDIGFSFTFHNLKNFNNLLSSNIPDSFHDKYFFDAAEAGLLTIKGSADPLDYVSYLSARLNDEEIEKDTELSEIISKVFFSDGDKGPYLKSFKLECCDSPVEKFGISGIKELHTTDTGIKVSMDCKLYGLLEQEMSKENEQLEYVERLRSFHFLPDKLLCYYRKINLTDEKIEKLAQERADNFIDNFKGNLWRIKTIFIPETINWLNSIFNGVIPDLNGNLLNYSFYKKNEEYINKAKIILEKNRNQLIEEIKKVLPEETLCKERTSKFLMLANKTLKDYYRSLKYLGPLRFLGSIHPFSAADDPKDVGISGEYTASVIELFADEIIMYIAPPDNEDDVSFYTTPEVKKDKFIAALLSWLKYFSIAEDIGDIKQAGNQGLEFKVKLSSDNRYHDLTNVGVGVSQVIPILTMCLLADFDSTLVFEQPEIHLHEKIQTKLIDFFIAMSYSGKQCVIETHTEHFINALRYRIAKTESPEDQKLIDNIQIYFTEIDKDKGTVYKPVGFNQYSALSDWPDGFFDESMKISDKIIKAAEKKWKKDNGGQC